MKRRVTSIRLSSLQGGDTAGASSFVCTNFMSPS